MIRITTQQSGGLTVVRIDGRLRKEGAVELEKLCGSIEGPLCLDLANLQSIDAHGVRTISELEAKGAAVTGVSPFIAMLLKRSGQS